jgi:acetyl esterase
MIRPGEMTAMSPIDPGIAPFLASVNDRASSRVPTLTDARRGAYRLGEIVAPKPPIEMYSVEDTAMRGPSTEIALRIYRPTPGPVPTVMYFHGGGWMTGKP